LNEQAEEKGLERCKYQSRLKPFSIFGQSKIGLSGKTKNQKIMLCSLLSTERIIERKIRETTR
jgi:hypothetical protein